MNFLSTTTAVNKAPLPPLDFDAERLQLIGEGKMGKERSGADRGPSAASPIIGGIFSHL